MKHIVTAALTLALLMPALPGCKSTQIDMPAATKPAVDDSYTLHTLDTNGDKKVSQEELREAARRHFIRLDRDNSGKIEIKPECGAGESWCRAADKNGDGVLTLPEFLDKTDAEFRKADLNKDKFLNREELKGAVLFRF